MKTALIVVDMLKDFTDENGKVFYPENKSILSQTNKLIKFFHETNRHVIFIKHRYRKDKFDKNLENMRPCCIEGTDGDEIDPALEVKDKDYQIYKRRYSSFYGTDLDLVLRENDIKRLVIVGTKTNNCIIATAYDAYYRDYEVCVAEDCVATNSKLKNNIYLEDIAKYLGDVYNSERIIEMLERENL